MRHEIFGAIAVVFFLLGFASYMRAISRAEVRPHFFTWLIWTVSTSIIFAAQIAAGAGPAAWTTGLSILFCGGVAIYAFFRGATNYTRLDWISLAVSLAAIPIWYVTRQPAYAAIINTFIDCMAYVPTFRKSYAQPHDEDLRCFTFDTIRHAANIFALANVSLTTAVYPVCVTLISFAFVVFLFWRRYKVKA